MSIHHLSRLWMDVRITNTDGETRVLPIQLGMLLMELRSIHIGCWGSSKRRDRKVLIRLSKARSDKTGEAFLALISVEGNRGVLKCLYEDKVTI